MSPSLRQKELWISHLHSTGTKPGTIPFEVGRLGADKYRKSYWNTVKVNRMIELPSFPKSRNLVFEDKPLLDELLKDEQPQISELTYTNLFAWKISEPVMLSRFRDALLLQRKRLHDGKTFQLPPLGKQNLVDTVKALRAEAEDFQMPPLYGLTSEQVDQLAKEGIATEPDRDDWDYVYLTRDLAELPIPPSWRLLFRAFLASASL